LGLPGIRNADDVGGVSSACFGTGDKLAVFDVWDSQQSFDRFGEILMPILKEIGVDMGQPQVTAIKEL
jgi:hypothetical protein